MARVLVVLALVAAAIVAATAWPRINEVETGRTPEYPDLQVREYRASPETVRQAVKDAVATLPRWSLVGEGSGPAGIALQAVHRTLVFRFKDDVTVKIRRQGGTTRVSVRSRSRLGKWDFGQNARNIHELLAELDRSLARKGGIGARKEGTRPSRDAAGRISTPGPAGDPLSLEVA